MVRGRCGDLQIQSMRIAETLVLRLTRWLFTSQSDPTARPSQGWDFADALHLALSEDCDDFAKLGADLAKRDAREVAGVEKVKPAVTKL